MKIETSEWILPAHWASYLINGDASSFSLYDDGEAELRVIDQIVKEAGACLTCSDDEGDFRKYHDAQPYGILACDCLTYTFTTYPQ